MLNHFNHFNHVKLLFINRDIKVLNIFKGLEDVEHIEVLLQQFGCFLNNLLVLNEFRALKESLQATRAHHQRNDWLKQNVNEAETDTLARFQDKQLLDDIRLVELRAKVKPKSREEE